MQPVAAYVTVTNMARSIDFYNSLFGKSPRHSDSRYTYYNIDGFSFGLFCASHDNEIIISGNNQILCFKVDNLETTYNHVKMIAETIDNNFTITDHVMLFQFQDPDHNILEIFQEVTK